VNRKVEGGVTVPCTPRVRQGTWTEEHGGNIVEVEGGRRGNRNLEIRKKDKFSNLLEEEGGATHFSGDSPENL